MSYDPLGRLAQSVSGGTTTQFLYDGDHLVAEYNGAGTTVLRRYVHGPGVDDPIVWYEGATLTTRNWLHGDERGSIIATSDNLAAATIYKYGDYGEPDSWSGSRFKYTGQIALPEAQLYHYKARVYDPALGRSLLCCWLPFRIPLHGQAPGYFIASLFWRSIQRRCLWCRKSLFTQAWM